MDFGTVKTDLRELLGRDVSSMAFGMARDALNKSLRILAMEKTVTLTTTAGALTMPADFEAVRVVKKNGVTLTAITSAATVQAGGSVEYYAIENGFIPISPAPSDGDSYTVTYFASLAELSDDSDTNAALSSAYEAFMFSVLYQHARLIRSADDAAMWGNDALRAINQANMKAVNERMGGPMEPRGAVLS